MASGKDEKGPVVPSRPARDVPVKAPRILPAAGGSSSPKVQQLVSALQGARAGNDKSEIKRLVGELQKLGYRA